MSAKGFPRGEKPLYGECVSEYIKCYLGTGPCPDCVDVNEDGTTTPADALCLFKKYLGQPSCLDDREQTTEDREVTDQILYYHLDHLNTPILITDQAGKIVWQAEYEPFGKATVNEDPDKNGKPVVSNIRLVGQYFDSESGLHYNMMRYYDPVRGRYLTPDPIGFAGGDLNLYRYCFNNPARWIDPWGLETVVIIIEGGNDLPHAAVRIDNSNHPVLYDPAGSYSVVDEYGARYRPSGGDAYYDNEAKLDNYIKYHESTGSNVTCYRFPTTPTDEAEIADRIEERGGTIPGFCTRSTSQVIQGIGPFKDLETKYLPSSLGNAMKDIQKELRCKR